jgi:hypothetical protein
MLKWSALLKLVHSQFMIFLHPPWPTYQFFRVNFSVLHVTIGQSCWLFESYTLSFHSFLDMVRLITVTCHFVAANNAS